MLAIAMLVWETGCAFAQVTNMNPHDPILTAMQFREIAGKTAAGNLPIETAETVPMITEMHGGPRVVIVFYSETGSPGMRTVHPPERLLEIHPSTGKVIRFRKIGPRDLGLAWPPPAVPGVGIDPAMTVEEFIAKRERFFAITPDVWRRFLNRARVALDDAGRELASEYWTLFSQITKADVAPMYVGAAGDFFGWLRSTAGK
jgi:hypothetical protein